MIVISLLSSVSAHPGAGIDSDFFPFGVFDKSDPDSESGNRETLVLTVCYSSAEDIYSGRKIELKHRGGESDLRYELALCEALFIRLR